MFAPGKARFMEAFAERVDAVAEKPPVLSQRQRLPAFGSAHGVGIVAGTSLEYELSTPFESTAVTT